MIFIILPILIHMTPEQPSFPAPYIVVMCFFLSLHTYTATQPVNIHTHTHTHFPTLSTRSHYTHTLLYFFGQHCKKSIRRKKNLSFFLSSEKSGSAVLINPGSQAKHFKQYCMPLVQLANGPLSATGPTHDVILDDEEGFENKV